MLIASAASDLYGRLWVYSVTRKPGSSSWFAGEKNGLRRVRYPPFPSLRSHLAMGAGSLQWGYPDLPPRGNPARPMPAVRDGEAGTAPLAGQSPALHEALCAGGRAAVPLHPGLPSGQGVPSGLAHGQGTGQAENRDTSKPRERHDEFCAPPQIIHLPTETSDTSSRRECWRLASHAV